MEMIESLQGYYPGTSGRYRLPGDEGLKHVQKRRRQRNMRSWLLSQFVFLDLDNKTGKDQYGRWVAVFYLANSDGSINLTRNFNRMLVDSGHAVIEGVKNNEFDPGS